MGASPPQRAPAHYTRTAACHPVDLAKPDHAVSRGPGSPTQPRAQTARAPLTRCDSPPGGRRDGRQTTQQQSLPNQPRARPAAIPETSPSGEDPPGGKTHNKANHKTDPSNPARYD
ncbi:hypothetical protein JCM33774_84530 [Actinophytocola sp. KF-1]